MSGCYVLQKQEQQQRPSHTLYKVILLYAVLYRASSSDQPARRALLAPNVKRHCLPIEFYAWKNHHTGLWA